MYFFFRKLVSAEEYIFCFLKELIYFCKNNCHNEELGVEIFQNNFFVLISLKNTILSKKMCEIQSFFE